MSTPLRGPLSGHSPLATLAFTADDAPALSAGAKTKPSTAPAAEPSLCSLPDHFGPDQKQIQRFIANHRACGGTAPTRREAAQQASVDRDELLAKRAVPRSLERAVAARTDLDKPLPMDDSSVEARAGQLRRLVQIDGNEKSDVDTISCGPANLVAAAYLQNPRGLCKVAAFELDRLRCEVFTGVSQLDLCALALRLDARVIERALRDLASGVATPRILNVLVQVLTYEAFLRKDEADGGRVQFKGHILNQGTRGFDLQNLAKQVFERGAGVPAPTMRLKRQTIGQPATGGGAASRSVPPENHWVVELDMKLRNPQTGAKISCVLTYDPWPNADGMANVGMANDSRAAKRHGLHPGSDAFQMNIRAKLRG